ncbi:MAG: NAD(P)H-dependent oxidoreductase [Caulobacterales bacterium]
MILIVYAHQEPTSFNHAMLETARETLTAAGHEVEVSDLYAMNFEARATRADFQEMRDATRFGYAREQYYANRTNTFAPDIAAELDKVRRCDTLILQFPLWWFSMPAIVKGWIDRVFANGATYGGSTGQFFERGMMAGKKAMVSVTTGAPAVMFNPAGMCGAMEAALWPIHNGILRFCGFDVMPPFIAHGVDIHDRETLTGILNDYSGRLRTLDQTEPMFFHPWSDYAGDMLLKPGIEGRTIGQRARTEYDSAPAQKSGADETDIPEITDMTAYMTVVLTVTDTSWIGEYVSHVQPLMAKHGGKPVTVSGLVEVLEGDEQPTQVATFAFPSMEALKAFMEDPEYLPWKEARLQGSTGSIFAYQSMK